MTLPEDSISPGQLRRRRARRAVVAIGVNFVAYVVLSSCIGGSAIHGRVEDGRHYVADQEGRYALVSREMFLVSRYWGWTAVASLPALLVAVVVMRRSGA
ncbi:MAG: hypothetical protein NTW19_20630 [Planctomycetota bacterium]|nr:hypothetical protein [Planctomycetota bacterium]